MCICVFVYLFRFNLFRLKCVNPLPRPVPDSACYVLIKSFPLSTWGDCKSGLLPHTSSSVFLYFFIYLCVFLNLSLCICLYLCVFMQERPNQRTHLQKCFTIHLWEYVCLCVCIFITQMKRLCYHHPNLKVLCPALCIVLFLWNYLNSGKPQAFEEDFLNVFIIVTFLRSLWSS